MSDVEIEVTEWKGDWPMKGKATVHAVRMGIGAPPEYSREEQTVALLRLAATVCSKTADKLERGEASGEFTSRLKIPAGEW